MFILSRIVSLTDNAAMRLTPHSNPSWQTSRFNYIISSRLPNVYIFLYPLGRNLYFKINYGEKRGKNTMNDFMFYFGAVNCNYDKYNLHYKLDTRNMAKGHILWVFIVHVFCTQEKQCFQHIFNWTKISWMVKEWLSRKKRKSKITPYNIKK